MNTDNSELVEKAMRAFISEYCGLLPEHISKDDIRNFLTPSHGDINPTIPALKAAISAIQSEGVNYIPESGKMAATGSVQAAHTESLPISEAPKDSPILVCQSQKGNAMKDNENDNHELKLISQSEYDAMRKRIQYLEGQIDSARNHISKGWNGSAASLLDACKPYNIYKPQ